jgi:ABC-type xylose transport system permease subunit
MRFRNSARPVMPSIIDKLSNIDRYRQTITIIVASLIVLSITSLQSPLVVGQIGALIGAVTCGITGYISTSMGRRLTVMICCIFGGAIVPALFSHVT